MSGFTLPGEYLIDLISKHSDKTLPADPKNLDDLTSEQVISTQMFAAQVTVFFGELTKLAKANKEFSANDLLPAVISCLYLAISQRESSAEEQLFALKKYEEALTAHYAAYLLIKESTDCPLSKTLANVTTSGECAFCLMTCCSAIHFLYEQITKAKNEGGVFVLNETEMAMKLTEEQNKKFLEALKCHEAEAEAMKKKEKLLAQLNVLIGKTNEIIDGLNAGELTPLCLIEASVRDACEIYSRNLVPIRTAVEANEEKDPIKLHAFLNEQCVEIQKATQTLANNENIEKLNKTKNNWLVQKLSDLVRSAYKLIKRPLPNWGWLYHPMNNDLQQVISSNPLLLSSFEKQGTDGPAEAMQRSSSAVESPDQRADKDRAPLIMTTRL